MTRSDLPARVRIRRPLETEWPAVMALLRTGNLHRIGGTEMPDFPLSDCFVAVLDRRVIGVSGYRIQDAETARNTLLCVQPQYRRLGIGRRVKQATMDYLRGRAICRVIANCDDLDVIAWNERHWGYRRTGERPLKRESFGRSDRDRWITIVADLTAEPRSS